MPSVEIQKTTYAVSHLSVEESKDDGTRRECGATEVKKDDSLTSANWKRVKQVGVHQRSQDSRTERVGYRRRNNQTRRSSVDKDEPTDAVMSADVYKVGGRERDGTTDVKKDDSFTSADQKYIKPFNMHQTSADSGRYRRQRTNQTRSRDAQFTKEPASCDDQDCKGGSSERRVYQKSSRSRHGARRNYRQRNQPTDKQNGYHNQTAQERLTEVLSTEYHKNKCSSRSQLEPTAAAAQPPPS